MLVKNTTARFQAFVQNQGRTREMLKKLLESDAEQWDGGLSGAAVA
jgi:cytochrome b